jgi:cell division protein FtsW (lipid II flippase)
MIASVSVYQSYQLTQRFVESGSWEAPSNAFYLWRSFMHMLVALSALGVTSIIPYHFWQRHARTLFLINMGFLILLFAPGLGNEYGTAEAGCISASSLFSRRNS